MGKHSYKSAEYDTAHQLLVGATADLRHLYRQMLDVHWNYNITWDSKRVHEAAQGLLGPAITRLEFATLNFERLKAKLDPIFYGSSKPTCGNGECNEFCSCNMKTNSCDIDFPEDDSCECGFCEMNQNLRKKQGENR